MPDICPPVCPCRPARAGVALLTWCVYSAAFAPVFFGASFAAVFAAAMKGNVPVLWTGIALLGLGSLYGGIHEIRRHGHDMHLDSVAWSVLVVAGVTYRLTIMPDSLIGSPDALGSPVSALDFHLVRMFLAGWGVSNAFNLGLQFRNVFRRRRPVVAAARPGPRGPVAVQRSRLPLLSRYVRVTETLEEIEGEALPVYPPVMGNSAALPAARASAEIIQHNGKLYIEHDGKLVPLREPDAVPVDRRRR
jgi:hypothetical protein